MSQYRKRLGGDDSFEACISNFQTLIVHQSTGPSCLWMSQRLGERWEQVASVSTGRHTPDALDLASSRTGSVSLSEQRRFLVEPSVFTTLARGGAAYNFEVEAILFKGGAIFANGLPYKRLKFVQEGHGK